MSCASERLHCRACPESFVQLADQGGRLGPGAFEQLLAHCRTCHADLAAQMGVLDQLYGERPRMAMKFETEPKGA